MDGGDELVLNLNFDVAKKPQKKPHGAQKSVNKLQQPSLVAPSKANAGGCQGQQHRQPQKSLNAKAGGTSQQADAKGSHGSATAKPQPQVEHKSQGSRQNGYAGKHKSLRGEAKQAGHGGKCQRGRDTSHGHAMDANDEDMLIRGADSEEAEDVAAMVAVLSKRDAQLEAELGARGDKAGPASQDPTGVVEFGSDNEDAGGRGGRRKHKFARVSATGEAEPDGAADSELLQGPGHSVEAAAGGRQKKQGKGKAKAGPGQQQQEQVVRWVPGQLGHAEPAGPGAASAELFGSEEAADTSTWEGLGLDPGLCAQLVACNFERPTRVQQGAVPAMLERRDTMVRAPTGSGKTLAYLVPVIQDLATQTPRLSRAEGTHALVVAPTRELCLQIHDVAMLLLKKYYWLVPGLVIGGENRVHEKARLRKGITVLVATPGRLMDHLQSTASFKIGELRWLILDEADRLLDLGFEAKLKAIIEVLDQRAEEMGGATEHKRTTALLSATLHERLTGLAAATLCNPATVGFTLAQGASGLELTTAPIGDGEEPEQQHHANGTGSSHQDANPGSFSIPSQLRQCCVFVECRQRLLALAGLIRQKLLKAGYKKGSEDVSGKGQGRKAVVFLSSCDGVELHFELLVKVWEAATGAPLLSSPGSSSSSTEPCVYKLHGDMPQAQRTANFLRFTQAQRAVLLCTDVAARGLDFPDVTHILQYDVPGAPAEYVHRVGRTARMGHGGESILFLMPHERPYLGMLASKGITMQEGSVDAALRCLPVPQDGGDEGYGGKGKKLRAGKPGKPSDVAIILQRRLMQEVASEPSLRSLASDAFRSFVRAYATHTSETKRAFHVRNLHLGHVAFAHALKEAPSTLGASGSAAERKRKRADEVASKQRKAKKQLFRGAQSITKS